MKRPDKPFVGTIVMIPATVWLALLLVLAVFVTMLLTSGMSEEEANLERKKIKLENKMKQEEKKQSSQ